MNQFTIIPAHQQPRVHHKRWKRDSRVSHEFRYQHKRSTVSRRFFRIVNCRDISLCIALGEAPLRSQRDFPQICMLTQPTNHVHIPMAACIPGRRSRHKVPSHCRGGYRPYVGYALIIVTPNFPNGERDGALPHLAPIPRERRGVGTIPVAPFSISCATLGTPHSTATPPFGRLPTGS